MELVIQVALGVVLAVIVLRYWRQIFAGVFGVLAILAMAVMAGIAFLFVSYSILGIFLVGLALFALGGKVAWRFEVNRGDNWAKSWEERRARRRRRRLGYDGTKEQ